LPALHDAELGRLLDRIGGVAPAFARPMILLGGLRLQQDERSPGCSGGDLAEDLAAVFSTTASVSRSSVAEA